MFENYEKAFAWDVRELAGWDMEDMEKEIEEYNKTMEDEAAEDAAQEAAYNEYMAIVAEIDEAMPF